MTINEIQPIKLCKKCFFFYPSQIDCMGCGGTPAFCDHPDCYETELRQTFEGKIYDREIRKKDIINFNPDGQCSRWESFHYEKVKTWWIFTKEVKKRGLDK